jgi:beta-lactamase class A
MKKFFIILSLIIVSTSFANAQKKQSKTVKPPYQTVVLQNSDDLQSLLKQGVDEALSKFAAKGLKAEDIAATLIDLRNPDKLTVANYRGNEKIYPASVSKMFYLVALHQQLENGRVKLTPEIERAMRDMIVDSSNESTQFIVDVITDTSSGSELSPNELEKWAFKRNAVNRYFTALGYQNINVCQKTFCEDAYGREQQFRGKDGVNRNKLTTNATARLMAEIALNKAVTPERSKQMMELMKRDWEVKEGKVFDGDDQAHGFTGIALKDLNLQGAKLWSKAGWTSKTRHDAAYIELPNGAKFVLVVFTENHATERDVIPTVARIILKEFAKNK